MLEPFQGVSYFDAYLLVSFCRQKGVWRATNNERKKQVVTNRGRTCFFGTRRALWAVLRTNSEWGFLIENCVAGLAGLFCDGSSVIGTSQVRPRPGPAAAAPATPRISKPPSFPGYTDNIQSGLCFSSALLRGIKTIRLRRVRGRVAGLLIEYDDRAEVLGAWDPAGTGAISTIYESSHDGPLNGLAIDRDQSQVVDVTAVTEKCPSPPAPRPSSHRETFQAGSKVSFPRTDDISPCFTSVTQLIKAHRLVV